MKIYHCKVKGCRFRIRTGSFEKAMKKMRKHKDRKHPGWRKSSRVRKTAKRLSRRTDQFTAREIKILKKIAGGF